MPRRTRSAFLPLVAALFLTATACSSAATTTSGDPAAKPPVRPSEQRQAQGKATATEGAGSVDTARLVKRAPELNGDVVLIRQDVTHGNSTLEFPAAGKGDGDALVVAVRCHGDGRLTVRLRPLGVDFPVDCAAREVGTFQHEFAVSAARRAGTVTVTASTASLRWSLSVGRGAPATVDLTP
jgi:hypothetical protein